LPVAVPRSNENAARLLSTLQPLPPRKTDRIG